MRRARRLALSGAFPAQGRVTQQDKEAVQLLARGAAQDELRTLFETLRFKRTDQSGLSTHDLLRRSVLRFSM